MISMVELMKQSKGKNMELSIEDMLQKECDEYNATIGHIEGFACSQCNNRGWLSIIEDGYVMRKECQCMKKRRTLGRIEDSGLSKQLNKCNFQSYKVNNEWQEGNKNKAEKFSKDYEGNWFYIGGQVGSGKTHLCTAIVGELLKQGLEAKYMLWRDEIVNLKRLVNDDEYQRIIKKYKQIKVLYIDDFFKTEKGKGPSAADINVAFEIINYRYNNPGLITIISSELTMRELLKVDEAVGSRIFERTKEYCSNIGQDISKNYRLKQKEVIE